MQFLGLDIGSSSVKVSAIDEEGKVVASAQYPDQEMPIDAPQAGFAEQDPAMWWEAIQKGIARLHENPAFNGQELGAIGITYQMHGLVTVDEDKNVIRPSIIWCDSRAVEIGDAAFKAIGESQCLNEFMNSPGNFTASKLKWVKENEPENFAKIHKFMLPGDYVGMKLTGEISTTISGLSEGILWNFKHNRLNTELLEHYGIPFTMVADVKETFTDHGVVTKEIAEQLGIKAGIPITYKAGDQPNNAFSLNVVNPGEIAATGGTSGVVYGVTDEAKCDPKSRVNPFAHVNHTEDTQRLGVLLCINGTGIANSWLQKNITSNMDYVSMNDAAEQSPIGANGLSYLPFGNGAERVLENSNVGAHYSNIDFNRHNQNDMIRATQEGIVFSFQYGIEVMQDMGLKPEVIRAGHANMFLSPLFRQTLANVCGAPIELLDTDGARGAATGAAVGVKHFNTFEEAFQSLNVIKTIMPETDKLKETQAAYALWKETLLKVLDKEHSTVQSS
ncbi:carbohydrate kinase [Flammeovirga yaeyamensis]|uniref:Carbohydrate kinase n=1 Tax=Flammeovirga yaeyamensis TaxID=367791 RepID=A0AAX1N2P1_9BACT|nr:MULTISPECIES: FGGY family carbohydrate kinase [Flammeovirga]ANQ50880.1 carbohydrate kinase [Flammeovirga sp. MY04]MBB3700713.1 xylulokinase [Flammeovirga yaeyamensis]NMF37929.1 carbohydrate kinase [Flammeovirga yaeyamensis]QWG01710.1 carbohydrate kinase [Flammeovirga yaeyamensis]